MKIAVTAETSTLDSNIDPRFGRCEYFLIIETDDFSFEALKNPNLTLGGGAGIQSAGTVVDKGVKTIITGNCGPKAHQALLAAGVEVITGCSGPVKKAVDDFNAGRLTPAGQANVDAHFGTGGMGGGRGMGGGGRGMGGGGRGMGGGRRRNP
jgi:predicted Fe-Mo cluster-binding NifX family protein